VADHVGEAYTLNNIGTVVNALGEPQLALGQLEQSLTIFRAAGERKGVAYANRDLGIIYYSLGEAESSIYYFRQALELSREVGDRQLEASCLLNVGLASNSLGHTEQALASLNEALTLQRAIGDHNGEAHTLNYLGTIYDTDRRGARQKALDYYGRALRLSRDPEVADRESEAQTLYNMGRVYSRLGEQQQAFGHFSQSLRLFSLIKNRRGAAFALHGMAGVERDRGRLDDALRHAEASVELIETLRDRIAGPDWRASFMASARGLYELNVDVLMRLHRARPRGGYLAQSLVVSERARARSLLELLLEQRADIRQGVSASLLERARGLEQMLNDKAEYQMRLLSGRHTPEEVAAVDAEITRLNVEHQEVEARIRAESPRYAALAQSASRPSALPLIQRGLPGDDTLLLEFFVGEEKSYLWLVSGDALNGFTLPGRAQVEEAAALVMSPLTEHGTREEFEAKAADLSRLLLGQAAPQLGRKRLVIIADGALEYVPFAALPAPSRGRRPYVPLINDHEVINLPSATVLATLREQLTRRTPAPKEVAVLADPVFTTSDTRVVRADGTHEGASGPPQAGNADRPHVSARPLDQLMRSGLSLERLPGTRKEAELILSLVPKESALAAFDFDASLATALSPRMRDYKIVHFATHGFFNPTRPELSGLILSLVDKNGAERNGFLSIPQVFGMSLAAELVVLSGCQTGQGKHVKGEGLIALTRGFMYAGAPRVVSTLWHVPDDATAELMGRFYGAMLRQGLRPGAALRAAQLSMSGDARWSAPQQWAGFIISGEWR